MPPHRIDFRAPSCLRDGIKWGGGGKGVGRERLKNISNNMMDTSKN